MFIATKEALETALKQAIMAAQTKSTLPILSHVLVTSFVHGPHQNKVWLDATDLTIGIRSFLPVSGSTSQRFVAPCKLFLEVVRRLPKKSQVTVDYADNKVTIQANNGPVMTIPCMDVGDYPVIGGVNPRRPVEAQKFLDALGRVLFAASNDQSRFNLNGVLFENAHNWTTLVATDGHRLASALTPAMWSTDTKFIVPKDALIVAMGLFAKGKDMRFSVDDKMVTWETDAVQLRSRLIDGDYPDYRKIIPTPRETTFTANREAWRSAIVSLEPFLGERNKGVDITVSGDMQIVAVNPDLGTQKVKVPLLQNGHECGFLINACYAKDALSMITEDVVTVEWAEEGAPIVLRPAGRKDYFTLIMPMRR